MKEKLTKNDSMTVEKISFDVLTAAFDAILSRNGVRLDYFFNWAQKKHLVSNRPIYQQWMNWAKSMEPLSWLIGAFLFDESNISYLIWQDVANQWLEYLKINLNK